MGLDLTPRDYLEMLTDEYQEYLKNPLSMRKAINCCGLSNALPEVIIVHQNPADSPDGLKRKASAYRKQLEQRCPAHHAVRAGRRSALRRRARAEATCLWVRRRTGDRPAGLVELPRGLFRTHTQDSRSGSRNFSSQRPVSPVRARAIPTTREIRRRPHALQ